MRKISILVLVGILCLSLSSCGSSKYDDAISQMDQGNYQAALDILSGITEHENAAEKIKECRYALGNEAVAAEDWDTAISHFTDLDYKDSGELLEHCSTVKGMSENADYEFIAAMEKSVLDRIDSVSSTNYDNATVVNTELVYVEKFKDATFYDADLKALAEKYVEGLIIQKEALKELRDGDLQVKWQRGLVYRYEVLRDLYENYGFLADNTDFIATYVSACDSQKELLDGMEALIDDIVTQMTELDSLWVDNHKVFCTLTNNTDYRFSATFELDCLDANGVIIEETSTYVDNIDAGSSYQISFYVSDPDSIYSFNYEAYFDAISLATPTKEITTVQQTYEDMQNATDYLSLTNNGYSIKGYPISKDSVTKIGDQLVVNQGVIYEEIGAGIDLYCDYGLSQVLDEAFFTVLTGEGTAPENWDDLSKELYGFISTDGTDKEIIAKLETLSCVNGTFDYEARKYEFEIADLGKAVEELQISEEMFGYVLAKLSEYPSEIVFDGNSVRITLEVKTYG